MQARFGRLRGVVPRADEPAHPVDFPCGAWFLVSAAGLKKVGLLDEAYFLYFEETDWAKRARNLGMTLHYLPACKAIHIGGGSSENQTPLAIIATFYESWFLYVRKHSVWGAPALLFLLLFPYLLLRTGFSGLRRRRESTRLQTRHVKALFWALTGKPSRSLAAGKFK
jgi:GT2 family glycosyltransferase